MRMQRRVLGESGKCLLGRNDIAEANRKGAKNEERHQVHAYDFADEQDQRDDQNAEDKCDFWRHSFMSVL